jgi:hypothetical protein
VVGLLGASTPNTSSSRRRWARTLSAWRMSQPCSAVPIAALLGLLERPLPNWLTSTMHQRSGSSTGPTTQSRSSSQAP